MNANTEHKWIHDYFVNIAIGSYFRSSRSFWKKDGARSAIKLSNIDGNYKLLFTCIFDYDERVASTEENFINPRLNIDQIYYNTTNS